MQPIHDKSLLVLASCIAEKATDDEIITHFEDAINRYRKAQKDGLDKDRLNMIFTEVVVFSYINILRTTGLSSKEILKDVDNLTRVYNLIKPPKN